MKKVFLLLAILLSVNLFTSCTNDMNEDISQIENHQSDDEDWNGDDVDDEED